VRKKMKKATKAKLLGIMTAALIVVVQLLTIGSETANNRIDESFKNEVLYIDTISEFKEASDYLTDEIRAYAANGDETHYNNYINELNTEKSREQAVATLQELGLNADEQAMVDEILMISNNLVTVEEKAVKYVQKGELQKATNLVFGEAYIAELEEINAIEHELKEEIEASIAVNYNKLSAVCKAFDTLSHVILIITMITSIVFITFVIRELVGPIIKTRDIMQSFARGDLSSEFKVEPDNTEVGETAQAVLDFQNFQKALISDMDTVLGEMADGNFDIDTENEEYYRGEYRNILDYTRTMNVKLDSTLKAVRQAILQVDAGANQVSAAAQSLSQGTTEQAASVQQLAATISEINEEVKKSGENAEAADVRTDEAEEMTQKCNDQMQEMVQAMEEINTTSQEIGKIVKSIEDIAFQTNILALNAAVEAARAGVAGKGFAVVADEVRNLAAKSAEASKNTATLIESSMAAVASGSQLANETAQQLQGVADASQSVADMVRDIAEIAAHQTLSVAQVSEGIDQISAVVQTNSATAEQSAAASEELSSQSAMVKELIGQFNLRDDGNDEFEY